MKISWLWIAFFTMGCGGMGASVSGTGGSIAVGGSSDLAGGSSSGGRTFASGSSTQSAGGISGSGGILGVSAGSGGSAGSAGTTSGGGTSLFRACKDTGTADSILQCRSANDCGPVGPIKCCTPGDCWTGAATCGISPLLCSGASDRLLCSQSSDCAAGGTCVSSVMGCPQCEYRKCEYPPPPPPKCTQDPDSCGTEARCQSDGTCAALLCTAGYSCLTGSRCNVSSARANEHGCELIPCNDGWACDENSRCTAPDDKTSHGCKVMSCTVDDDCDCGYCVNGSCLSNLGTCTQPAQ
jgi:hypothetical protein